MGNMNRGVAMGAAFAITAGGGAFGINNLFRGEVAAAVATDADADADPQGLFTPYSEGADCLALVEKHGQLLPGQSQATIAVKGIELVVFRLGAASDGKLYEDGPNVPLKDQTTEGVQASMCQDPGEAGMFLAALHDPRAKIGGKTPGEVNAEWIPPQLKTLDGVNDWVASVMTNDVTKHNEAQRVMASAAALWGKFHQNGIVSAKTTANVHLPDGEGSKIEGVPEFAWNADEAYNGKFMSASYRTKTGGCVLNIGLNVGKETIDGGDQRFAILPCSIGDVQGKTSNSSPTSVPSRTTPPPTPSTSSGKHQPEAQTQDAPIVPAPTGGHVGRDGTVHATPYTPPESTSSTTDPGQEDSGSGAVNTTENPAPATPSWSNPAPSAPVTNPVEQ